MTHFYSGDIALNMYRSIHQGPYVSAPIYLNPAVDYLVLRLHPDISKDNSLQYEVIRWLSREDNDLFPTVIPWDRSKILCAAAVDRDEHTTVYIILSALDDMEDDEYPDPVMLGIGGVNLGISDFGELEYLVGRIIIASMCSLLIACVKADAE